MANGKAKTSKSMVDEIKELKREKAKNFGIGRQTKGVPASVGVPLGASGSKGGTDSNDNQLSYIKTAGDTMVGPLAFYPIAITMSDNYLQVSEGNGFSSRLVVAGEGAAADDIVSIVGAAHAGQILFLQATETTDITLKDRAGSGTAWATSTAYVAGDIRANGGLLYVCHTGHTSSASDEPGVGASWEDYWYKGNVYIPSGNDYVVSGKEIVMLQWDTINETWTIVSNFNDGAGGGGSQTPWTSNIDADGFDLQDLSNIEFRDTTGAPAGTSPSIYNEVTGITLNVPTGDSFTIDVNAVAQYQFDATSLQMGTNDLDMGTGNIIAGGATEGMTNTGHIDFIDNTATPAAAISLYSDGTDLFANTGGGTVNLSNVGGSNFVDNVFTVVDNTDGTKKMAFEVSGVTTATTRTFTVPDANGTLVITPAVQTLDMNGNTLTAGGATVQINNVGELAFVNNTATPAGNGIIFFDGTDLKAKTGSTTVNLTNISGANFTDAVFRVTDELDTTKKFAVDVTSNTTGTTATLAFGVTADRTITFPDATTTLAGLSTTHTWTGVNTFSQSIVAGGAGEGMTSIGHLDFTDNLATPAAIVSLYSDGTNLLSKSTIDLNGNDLIGVDDITFNLAGQSINTDAVGMAIQVPTGDTIDFLVNGSRMTLSETAFDVKVDLELNANDLLTQGGNINTANGTITTGTGQITGGGTDKGIDNVSTIEFTAVTGTPAYAAGFYSIGNVMYMRSSTASYNLENIASGTFTDAVFRVQDELDATKEFIIDVTGNTTATTATLDFNTSASRVYTFPDVTGEVVTTTGVQTISGAKAFSDDVTFGGAGFGADTAGFITFVDNLATPAAALAIYGSGTDLLVSTGGGTVNLSDVGDGVFPDNTFRIQDNGDNTKQLAFEVSGLTTATTRTITMPDANVNLGALDNSNLAGGVFSSILGIGVQSQALNMSNNAINNFDYLEANGTAATAGAIRLVNNTNVAWDNVGTGNSHIELDASDNFNFVNNSVNEFTIDTSNNEINLQTNHLKMANASEIRWEASPAGTDITLSVDASEQMLLRNATKFEFSASSGGATVSNGALDSTMTASSVTVNGAFLYSDGIRQTFNPNATNAGINVGGHTADPSSPTAGDIYYDSTNHKFRIATGASPAWGDLGSGTVFADDVFRIEGSVDATKELAFEVDGLTTATTRTITMPDADVNLGALTDSNLATGVFASITGLGTQSQTLNMGSQSITNASIDAGLIDSGILGIARGGTGNATNARGDILYAPSAATWSRLAVGTAGQFLKSDGTDVVWSSHGLDINDLTDVVITSPAANQVLTYNGSAWVNQAAAGGSQTPWTSDIDADQFSLLDLDHIEFTEDTVLPVSTLHYIAMASNNMHYNTGTTSDGHLMKVAGNQKFGVGNSTASLFVDLDMNNNFIQFDAIAPPTATTGEPKLFADNESTETLYKDTLSIETGDGSSGITHLERLPMQSVHMQTHHQTTRFDHDFWMSNVTFGEADEDDPLDSYETMATDGIFYYPIFIGRPVTIQRIGIDVGTLDVDQVSIGLYSNRNDGENYPKTKLDSVDNQTLNTTGIYSVFIDYDITEPGLYWLAFWIDGGNTSTYRHVAAQALPNVGWHTLNASTGKMLPVEAYKEELHTSATLPSTADNEMNSYQGTADGRHLAMFYKCVELSTSV